MPNQTAHGLLPSFNWLHHFVGTRSFLTRILNCMDFGYPTYINQSIHTYIHSPFHTYIHNSIHAFNSPYIHSTIHTYIHSINAYIHQSIHTFNSPYKHTHIQSIHTFTSLYIHSSVHTFTSPYVHHFHTHLKYLGMTSLEEFEAYWRSKSRALN